MRFNDSLETVLAADVSTPIGAELAWRQLVDLVGRRRVADDPRAFAAIEALYPRVSPRARAAAARADRKSTRLNSSHSGESRMPASA